MAAITLDVVGGVALTAGGASTLAAWLARPRGAGAAARSGCLAGTRTRSLIG